MELKQPDGHYSSITKESDLRHLTYVLKDLYDEFAIDTETDSVNSLQCNLLGISISQKEGFGWYIPVRRHQKQISLWDSLDNVLDLEIIREYLNQVLPNKRLIMHNAKFDIHVLERHGFIINTSNIYDTLLSAIVLGNVEGGKYGLKHLAETKLGYKMLEFKEITKGRTFDEVPLETATFYASSDTDMTLRIKNLEESIYPKYPSLINTRDLEFQCLPILSEMEKVGTLIDVDYLRSLQKPIKREIKFYSEMVYELAGRKFNLESKVELKNNLDRILKTNLPNTTESTIKNIDNPIIENLLQYRKRFKLDSVYITGLLDRVDENNRLHTEYYQIKKTGRLSSNNPNLQNIPTPKDNIDLPLIRRAFIAPPGYKFVSIDYSQLELRIITHVAQEPYWIKAFENNADIHLATAAAVFNKNPEDVTAYERKQAKFTNFGLLYGESAYGLSKRTGMTIDEAEKFIEDYFVVLPKVREYIENTKDFLHKNKYIENICGRRLYFKYDKNDYKSVGSAEREAINYPIQSGAAEIVKKAMVEVGRHLSDGRYKTNLLLQVHDELDFEMAEDEIDILIPTITEIMNNVMRLDVSLLVDQEIGDNWEDLNKYE